MPEIPEMEVYRHYLMENVMGKLIDQVTVNRSKSINVDEKEFSQRLVRQIIIQVERKGKALVLGLTNGSYLLTHMMLDGRLYLQQAGEELPVKEPGHVVLVFSDGSKLHFQDMRLGYVHILNEEQLISQLSILGVDPFSEEYTDEFFRKLCRKRRGMIKPLLINQKAIAGVGNAYSNEALFVAGVLPERPANKLSDQEIVLLYQAIPAVLQEAIKYGGYIEEPFASWDTFSGGVNKHFRVYDREGERCIACGQLIQAKEVSGRWSYFCPRCQK